MIENLYFSCYCDLVLKYIGNDANLWNLQLYLETYKAKWQTAYKICIVIMLICLPSFHL